MKYEHLMTLKDKLELSVILEDLADVRKRRRRLGDRLRQRAAVQRRKEQGL